MVQVSFTPILRRLFSNLETVDINANDVASAIDAIDDLFIGIKSYILDESGSLRKDVALFVNDEIIRSTNIELASDDRLAIMQSLSGG